MGKYRLKNGEMKSSDAVEFRAKEVTREFSLDCDELTNVGKMRNYIFGFDRLLRNI